MTYQYDENGDIVDEESSTADFGETQVSENKSADPFTQGIQATGKTSNPYSTRADLLKSYADAASNDAIENLKRALNNKPTVTPKQGALAALLSIVPTVGGAIIGKTVGNAKMPAGTFGAKLEDTGMGAGGLIGLKAGMKASGDYLSSLDDTTEEDNILMRLAEYQNRRAGNLYQQANQTELAGLKSKEEEKLANQKYQNQLAIEKYRATHRAADKPTVAESTTKAWSSFMSNYPDLAAEVAQNGLKNVSKEDFLKIPPELFNSQINQAERSANTEERLNYTIRGGHEIMARAGDFVPINPSITTKPLAPQVAEKFNSEIVVPVKQALGNLNLAKEAFKRLGTISSLEGLTPEDTQAIGIALQRVKEANLSTIGAMGQLAGMSPGQSDAKMNLLMNNALPEIVTAMNIDMNKAKQLIFVNKDLILGKLGEIQAELARRTGTVAQTLGYQSARPIAGMDIAGWDKDPAALAAALKTRKEQILSKYQGQ